MTRKVLSLPLLVLGMSLLAAGCASTMQTAGVSSGPASEPPMAPPAARQPAAPSEPPMAVPPAGEPLVPPRFEAAPRPNEIVEQVPGGTVDWGGRVVRARGSGIADPAITVPAQARLMAERAAIVNAQRNLLEIVKGVRIDSDTKVENFMTKYDVVYSQVSGFVQGARQVGPTRWDEAQGVAEVELEMNLIGPQSVAEALQPALGTPPDQAGMANVAMTPEVQNFFRQYSGLVFQSSDSTLKPGLFPRIYDENGNLLLDTRDYYRYTGQYGRYAVQYVNKLDEILNRPEFAKQPLVIKVKQWRGKLGADIVVARGDVDKLKWLKDGGKWLLEAGRLLVKLLL